MGALLHRYRASGRTRLVDEVERLFWRGERYNRLVLSSPERFRESVARYATFLEACEARDPVAAEQAVQASIGWAVDRVGPLLRVGDGERMTVLELRDALVEALGDPGRVSDGESERDLHAGDITFHRPHRPDVVVYATTTEEVSAVLALADERRIPVTPFGAGSSLEGHVIPVEGGISLDLTRMDRVVDVSPADLTATVQAGVTRSALERATAEHGLFFPVDPGADATLGGMAATNAAGTTTVRYGKIRANVLALEAVLRRRPRRPRREPRAQDLGRVRPLGLLIGSEGTLGVITELTVRLHGSPSTPSCSRIAFPDVEAACRAATTSSRRGRASLGSSCSTPGRSGRSTPIRDRAPRPVALRRGDGSEGTVDPTWSSSRVAATEGAADGRRRARPTARTRLWAARHASAYAWLAAAAREAARSTDICVPLSELAGAVSFAREELERSGWSAGIVGHAGDGNVHLALMSTPTTPTRSARPTS